MPILERPENRILERSVELFLRHGIKSLTMEDISRELGISKKTLYHFFENKDDLVTRGIEWHLNREKEKNIAYHEASDNALHEVLLCTREVLTDASRVKSNILFELQKFHRDAWLKVQQFHHDFFYKIVYDNLERGVREKLYRADINPDIITRLYIAQSLCILDETFFPRAQYPLETVFKQFLMHHLRGITTPKGQQYLDEKFFTTNG